MPHADFQKLVNRFADDHDTLRSALAKLKTLPESVERALPSQKVPSGIVSRPTPTNYTKPLPKQVNTRVSNGIVSPALSKNSPLAENKSINRYQQELLNGIAELNSIGIAQPTRRQLSFATAKALNSSHFSNMLGALRTSGYIEYPGNGRVGLTDLGSSIAMADDAPQNLDALHNRVRNLLNSYQIRIFNELVRIYPAELSREQLAAAIDASADSSHFSNMIGAMRTVEVATYPSKGFVRADDSLFPAGLS